MDSPRKEKLVTKTSGSSLLLDLHQISKIFAWGEGKEGTLGHGESTNSTTPVLIGGFDSINFTTVSAGLYHSVAISVDGKLYSWGRGENGRLGHGDVLTRFRPKAIEFQQADTEVVPIDGVKFRVVSAGYHHNVAIDSEGHLYSWGSGWSGQLGHSTTDDIKRPMLLLNTSATRSTSSNALIGNKTVVSRSSVLQASEPDKRRSLKESIKNDAETRFLTAAAGFHHSLAITESGKLYSWGFGEHGQLGHGDKKRVTKPRLISAAKDVTFKQVSASEYHSLALSTDGKIYAWGWGEFGELGLGLDNKQVSVPTPVLVRGNARAFKAVAAGAYLSVALCTDGHLYTAGRQLRERSPFNYEFTKMEGAGHLRFVQVSAKNNHVLLLSEDSIIYSWGHNTVGQLGYEGEGDLIPKPVSSPHFSAAGVAVLQVSAGGNHSLALAKVPLELSTSLSQSQVSSPLSSSQISTPISNSKSAPSSPATPQSRVRSQQLVLAMMESSNEAAQSKGRDRSFTVEVSSPRSADTDLESSHKKEKREKKRSKSKLEDSGSRTSRPRLENDSSSSSKRSSKQISKGEIMTNAEIQNKINDLMAKQHDALKSEQKLLKQKEEILKKETKLKQDMADIENSLKMYLNMLMSKLNSGSRVSIGPVSEKQ